MAAFRLFRLLFLWFWIPPVHKFSGFHHDMGIGLYHPPICVPCCVLFLKLFIFFFLSLLLFSPASISYLDVWLLLGALFHHDIPTPLTFIPNLMLSLYPLLTPTEPIPPRHFPSPAPSITHSIISSLLRVHEAPCMRAWEPCKGDPSSSFAASSTLPSCACKGRSCWLRPRTQTPGRSCRFHSRTPTLERDGEGGMGGDNRGGGVEFGHPGQISRPSGVASLTFISSVAVSGGEEEEHVMKGLMRDED